MQPHPFLARMAGFALLVTLLVACGGPTPPEIATIASLPSGRHLVIQAEIYNTDLPSEFFVLKPGDSTLSKWQVQVEKASWCTGLGDSEIWNAADRTLIIGGCFYDQSGLNVISADGLVTNLATIEGTQRENSAVMDIAYSLRGGAVQLPSGVEHLSYYRHAQHHNAFAFTGTIYVGEPGKATPHISLYVVGEDDRVTAYGEAMNFSEMSELRWSPDDSAISFIANSRFYRLDLGSGTIARLSDVDALIDSSAEFTADGGLIFTGRAGAGAVPAFYHVAAGESTATAVVALDNIPQIEDWRGEFLLSPDGQQVAFEARRDNPATEWTISVADLSSGAIRDLLPSDLQIQRTGVEGAEGPYPTLLAWSPDGQQLVFSSNITGYCNNNNAGGVVNCTRHIYAVPAGGGAPGRLSETHLESVSYAIWVE
jgi:dipeptidyl aminopeptidase/acylaminoacyl peptidase